MLPARALAPDGRTVRCTECNGEWFERPDQEELNADLENPLEDIPESVKPIPEGSGVPAISTGANTNAAQGNRKANIIGYIAAFVVFILILFALILSKDTILRNAPYFAPFYEAMGIKVQPPGYGLVFDRVTARIDGGEKIVIEGSIVNLESTEQILPTLEIAIFDEAGGIIENAYINPPQSTMPAESTIPFHTIYESNISAVDHVRVRFVLIGGQSKSVEANDHEAEEPAAHNEDHVQQPTHESPKHETHH